DADVRVEGVREPQEVLRRLESLRGDVMGGDCVMAAEPKLDVRALLERGLRELDPGLPGGPVRDDAHVVDRLHGGTGDNADPLPLQLPRPDPADHALHDLLRVRELRLLLLELRRHELDAELLQGPDVGRDQGVVVHRLVHRGRDQDRDPRPEGVLCERRHDGVVDPRRDLRHRVRRRGGDQEEVRGPVRPDEFDVRDRPIDAEDWLPPRGEVEGVRVDDLRRVLRQDGDDLGAVADQLACQFDGLHRRDAPGDREDDLFPLQLLRLHGVDPAARMHGDAPKSDPAIYLSRARVGWGSPTVRNPYGGRIFPRRGGMSMQPAPVAPGPPLPPSEPWSGAPYVGMYPAPAPRGALRFMGIPIGVLLIVGLAILHIAILIPRPFSGFGQPDPATQAYLNTVRTLMGVAFGTVDVAIGLTVAFAWHAAVARPDLPEASRRGLMAFAGIFVGSWMIVTFVTVLLAGTFSIFFR